MHIHMNIYIYMHMKSVCLFLYVERERDKYTLYMCIYICTYLCLFTYLSTCFFHFSSVFKPPCLLGHLWGSPPAFDGFWKPGCEAAAAHGSAGFTEEAAHTSQGAPPHKVGESPSSPGSTKVPGSQSFIGSPGVGLWSDPR